MTCNLFSFLWNSATEVDYNPDWANTTGYFDNVVNHKWPRSVSKFVDMYDREVIVINFSDHLLVANQRFKGNYDIIVTNKYWKSHGR